MCDTFFRLFCLILYLTIKGLKQFQDEEISDKNINLNSLLNEINIENVAQIKLIWNTPSDSSMEV